MAFDDSEAPPLVFANQVIKMLGEHLLGDSAELDPEDYLLIRVVFRKLGGSWFEVCQGSPKHTNLLIESIKAWGSKDR
jgi:hypothetical protein